MDQQELRVELHGCFPTHRTASRALLSQRQSHRPETRLLLPLPPGSCQLRTSLEFWVADRKTAISQLRKPLAASMKNHLVAFQSLASNLDREVGV